jgi:protein-S-isoprenylcysteine O-methyltransferase Ste14
MRAFWIVFGVAAQFLLIPTVWYLFPFLQGGTPASPASGLNETAGLALDALLAAQFAVLHSLLLHPAVRDRLECFVPRPLYGCFFAVMTCGSLLLAILAWQPSAVVLWELTGTARAVVSAGYLLSWVGLFYTLSLSGLGFQTGWLPYWAWLTGRAAPRRRFEPRGAYRLLRHPVYLSFLGLIWFTPVMTPDRAVLTALWTLYVFAGSYLKDRRLEMYLGDVYREYQARVPGYPFLWFGSLGRVKAAQDV